MNIKHYSLEINTGSGIALHDVTADSVNHVSLSGISNGFISVTSQHTTTALSINENEERLVEDVKSFLQRLIPADDNYLHNDIELRDRAPDEPENAHSHLAAMLLGSSEVIHLVDGRLVLGQWQSVMLFELDGPRSKKVVIQIIGE